jgi:DNA-binding PadR family transcriptional regulator
MQECPSWKREVGRIPTLGDAGVTSDGAEKELRGRMRFLLSRGFDVLEQVESGVNYNQSIAEALGMSKKDSLMALHRLREMGLIFQSKKGKQGRKEYGLTDDGMRALIAYRTLPCADLRAEFERMMGLEGRRRLSDEERSRIRECMNEVDESDAGGAYDALRNLGDLLREIENSGIERWFEEESLFERMGEFVKRDLPVPAKVLAIRLEGRVISTACGYQKWASRTLGMIDPLKEMVLDDDLEDEIRLESINTLRRYRTPLKGIPGEVFEAFLEIVWDYQSPDHGSFMLEEQAIDEILEEWAPFLDEEQRTILRRTDHFEAPSFPEFTRIMKREEVLDSKRMIDGARLSAYRSSIQRLVR